MKKGMPFLKALMLLVLIHLFSVGLVIGQNVDSIGLLLNNNTIPNQTDPCAEACAQGAAEIVMAVVAVVFAEFHNYMNDKLSDEYVLSASFNPQFAFGGYKTSTQTPLFIRALPEISGRYGIYSIAYRLNYAVPLTNLNEIPALGWDFVIGQINVQFANELRFFFGSGMSKSTSMDNVSLLSIGGFEISDESKRLRFLNTFRYVPENAYFEVNSQMHYRIYAQRLFSAHIVSGILYSNTAENTDAFNVQAGLNFSFHREHYQRIPDEQ